MVRSPPSRTDPETAHLKRSDAAEVVGKVKGLVHEQAAQTGRDLPEHPDGPTSAVAGGTPKGPPATAHRVRADVDPIAVPPGPGEKGAYVMRAHDRPLHLGGLRRAREPPGGTAQIRLKFHVLLAVATSANIAVAISAMAGPDGRSAWKETYRPTTADSAPISAPMSMTPTNRLAKR